MPTLIRSKRRSLSIEVKPDSTIIIKAPLKMPSAYIEKFLASKENWIRRKQAHFKNLSQVFPQPTFENGMAVWYLGNCYQLNLVQQKMQAKLDETTLTLYVPNTKPETVKRRLSLWYKTLALDIITDRVEYFLPSVNKPYRDLKIKTLKRQWGHCSRAGHLGFNWILMMAPLDVVDYVVVHECCHLLVHNHSMAFWKEVERILPQYKNQERWLKENGPGLLRQYFHDS